MLDICAKLYDHRSKHKVIKPPPPPPPADGSKSLCQIGLRGYVPDKILSDSIFNKYIYIYRIEKMLITCTTFICQSICVKIPDWTFVICTVSLCFMKKNWKGPLARHEKTNVLCIISSLNLFPSNSLKRLSISAFKSVSR